MTDLRVKLREWDKGFGDGSLAGVVANDLDTCMEAMNEIADICNTTIFTDQETANEVIDRAYDTFRRIEVQMDIVRDIILGVEK